MNNILTGVRDMLFRNLSDKTRELLYLNPGMHIESNRELLIENCHRIEEYNEIYMRLIAGNLCIQIWGSGLRAYDYKTKGLVVRGKISQIEFIERSGKNNAKSTERLYKD